MEVRLSFYAPAALYTLRSLPFEYKLYFCVYYYAPVAPVTVHHRNIWSSCNGSSLYRADCRALHVKVSRSSDIDPMRKLKERRGTENWDTSHASTSRPTVICHVIGVALYQDCLSSRTHQSVCLVLVCWFVVCINI
jgi:hypothetical protein